jgi:hypothetical protein
LPLRQASGLREPGLRKRILSLSKGITVRICRLLEEAAVQAIVSGRERIELETLSEELLNQEPGVHFRAAAAACRFPRKRLRKGHPMSLFISLPPHLFLAPRPLQGELLSSWCHLQLNRKPARGVPLGVSN